MVSAVSLGAGAASLPWGLDFEEEESWESTKDGAASFGYSVKNFFQTLFR